MKALRTLTAVALALSLAGCPDAAVTEVDAGDDASAGIVLQPDTGAPPAVDAGPLWQSCNTGVPASCPSGLECLTAHTVPIDAYATCVFTCAGANEPLCATSGGECVCPLPLGSANGPPGDCSSGNATGAVTVCAPAGDASAPGTNQVEDAGPTDASSSPG